MGHAGLIFLLSHYVMLYLFVAWTLEIVLHIA